MQIVRTVPVTQSTGVFTDDNLILTFNEELEGSYLSGTYFKLYRTNESMGEFYDLIDCAITKSDVDVTVNPTLNLLPQNFYVLIVIGGISGVQSISGGTLSSNYILFFRTGESVRPVSSGVSVINEVDLFVGGALSPDMNESVDLFSTSGETVPIGLLRSIPPDQSVGVGSLEKVIFIYNDEVDQSFPIPVNALIGTYTDLPLDMNPFENRSITAQGSPSVEGNQVIFSGITVGDTNNREYTFRLSPGVVRGTSRRGFDQRMRTVRFLGPLTPLYALPSQITARLTAWGDDATANISDYDLYKLIHQVSSYFVERSGIVMTNTNSMAVNRAIICMVLLEITTMGLLSFGGIKARELLATKVQYYERKLDDIAKTLDKCIDEALSSVGQATAIAGIKSGRVLDRNTKFYNSIYR